jgi:hypothetical protein
MTLCNMRPYSLIENNKETDHCMGMLEIGNVKYEKVEEVLPAR